MGRPAVVVGLLVVSVVLVGPAAAGNGLVALGALQDFDRVQFTVTVAANGTADWTFRYERRLANETERQRFETFADRFVTEETQLFRDFRNQTMALTDTGRAATGRAMNATGISRDAYVREGINTVGVVELSFTWTAFAATNGKRVIVGDVFEGGFYLGPDQAFVIAAGDGLQFETVEPAGTFSGPTPAASDTVTWQGERTFADNHPRVVLVPVGTGTPTTDRPGTEASPGSPETATPVTGSGTQWGLLGLVLIFVIGALAAFVWFRRGGIDVAVSQPSGGEGPSLTQAELMEDEERVVSLIEDNGGQMRQSAIVDETGWSKSKVSMVLSEMTDDGTVSKLQLGRENLISLPGHEPEAVGSPLDDLERESDE